MSNMVTGSHDRVLLGRIFAGLSGGAEPWTDRGTPVEKAREHGYVDKVERMGTPLL